MLLAMSNTRPSAYSIPGYLGQYQEAESLVSKVLEVRRRVLGDKHRNTLVSMGSLAVIFKAGPS